MPVHCGPQSEQDLLSTQEVTESATPSLMDQIKENMSQLLQKAAQEEEGWKKQIASLETENQENINSFQQERSMLEAEVESTKCTLYDSQKYIKSLQEQKDMLEAEVESSKCTLYERRKYINSLQQEYDKLEAKMESMEHTLDDRQQNINSLQLEKDELDAKVKDLERTLDDRKQNINSLQQENKTLKAKVRRMACTLDKRQENINSLQLEKDELDAKATNLEHTLDDRKQNINSLQQENNMLKTKARRMTDTLFSRQENINSLQQENNMLKAKVQSMACTLDKRQENINSLQLRKDELDAKVKDLERTLDNRKQNINSLQQENNKLKTKARRMTGTLCLRQDNINSLQKEQGVLDAKVKELASTLHESQQSINNLWQEKSTLEAKVKKLENQNQMDDQRIKDLLMSRQALRRILYSSSYQMRLRSRFSQGKNGCALIINNTQFTTSAMTERTGAERDHQKLAKAFQSLPANIDVMTHQNLELSTMLSILRDEANRDHKEEDFFICCIMSHGTQGKVSASDGFSAELLDILSLFKGKQCPTLMGKPKLFFISACQGDKDQNSEKEAHSDASPSPILAYLSTEADFFLALATVPGYVSYRGEDGAHFVDVLAKVLKEDGKSQDLMSMMATVSREMNKKFKYSPFCCTTLRHKLFFNDYPYMYHCSTLPLTIETPNDRWRQQSNRPQPNRPQPNRPQPNRPQLPIQDVRPMCRVYAE